MKVMASVKKSVGTAKLLKKKSLENYCKDPRHKQRQG